MNSVKRSTMNNAFGALIPIEFPKRGSVIAGGLGCFESGELRIQEEGYW